VLGWALGMAESMSGGGGGAAGVVIALSAFERWGPWGYMVFCAACALPLVVVPLVYPSAADRKLPWHERYIVKANVWIAIFSFIGNYWCVDLD
jgi:cycloeucalenol cycloisomerase